MEISRMTECSVEDFGQIERLTGILSATAKAGMDIVREVLASSNSQLFVARDGNGQIAGMATVCCFTIPTGRHATIEDVVVLPECRGIGLGRRLVEEVLAYLKASGYRYKVGLTSRPSRTEANALYRSMGFRQKETNVYMMDV